jgi:hypothetical protein
MQLTDGSVKLWTLEDELAHYRQYGPYLDAYILTDTLTQGGVRYGKEGDQYLSPALSLSKLRELIRKEQQKRRRSA